MSAALRAEWTKLRTLPGNVWLLVGVLAGTAGISAAAGAFTQTSGITRNGDTTKLSLSGVYLGQLLVAALASIAISEEFATGMICLTLTATPRRIAVLTAKASNLVGLIALAGAGGVSCSLVIGRLLLPADGLDPAHGYPFISLASAGTARAAAGTVIYLGLVALLSLGVATVIRDTAVSIGAIVALLYLPPLLADVVGGSLGRHITQIAPMSAGLAIQTTTQLRALPVQPWAGLGILACWAAGSLLLAATTLHVRDA
jgi:ABC-2 type transport system permease protein